MVTLTAADFADTGQWRLLLKISPVALEAFLENTLHPDLEPQPLCKAQWELNRDEMRNNIENAVYNNPRLLDDFATKIILYDPCTLFIPTDLAEEYLGAEEDIFRKVYTAEPADIMTDSDGDLTAAWAMAPGLKSFLMRSFPGARISCNLLDKVRELRKTNDGLSLFAIARKGEVDIILLNNKELYSASTHEWQHPDDIAYLVFNLLEVYEKPIEDTALTVDGLPAATDAWKYLASKAGNFINKNIYNENNQW